MEFVLEHQIVYLVISNRISCKNHDKMRVILHKEKHKKELSTYTTRFTINIQKNWNNERKRKTEGNKVHKASKCNDSKSKMRWKWNE